MPDSLKYRLKQLPLTKKIILIGSFLAIIGVFMPWYQDIDKFNTGDMFLGISGPLYLAGLIVLLTGIASFGIILLKLLNKPVPKLPLKEDHFHIFNSALSILMLILSVSVFFHNKFGINVIDKSMGIGMFFTFIGSGLLLIGAVWTMKKGEVDFNAEGELKPLIKVGETEREQRDLDKEKVFEKPQQDKSSVQESLDNYSGNEKNDDIMRY